MVEGQVIFFSYSKVARSNMSHLEVHAGFFRLLMNGIFDAYLNDLLTKNIFLNY